MTPLEVKDLALAHLGSWGITVDSIPDAVFYNRISSRQQELYGWVHSVDRDFYGIVVDLPLVDEAVEVPDLMESVDEIFIGSPGTSGYWPNDKVRVVRNDDWMWHPPPRVTLRNGWIRGSGEDMVGVISLKLAGTRRPAEISPKGEGDIDLPLPYQDLLALDLAKFVLIRDPETVSSPAMAFFVNEEERKIAAFREHIVGRYRALEARFP
jgi:hypothetical protein